MPSGRTPRSRWRAGQGMDSSLPPRYRSDRVAVAGGLDEPAKVPRRSAAARLDPLSARPLRSRHSLANTTQRAQRGWQGQASSSPASAHPGSPWRWARRSSPSRRAAAPEQASPVDQRRRSSLSLSISGGRAGRSPISRRRSSPPVDQSPWSRSGLSISPQAGSSSISPQSAAPSLLALRDLAVPIEPVQLLVSVPVDVPAAVLALGALTGFPCFSCPPGASASRRGATPRRQG